MEHYFPGNGEETSGVLDHGRTVVTALDYASGQLCTIKMSEGRIESKEAVDSGGDIDSTTLYVAPGLVDLQINGYAGADFNQLPIPAGMTSQMSRSLWREGVTSYCPTVITNSPEAILEAMEAIDRDCQDDPDTERAVAGIHLEGPFISPEDGARGAHLAAAVMAPDWEWFSRWQEAAGGRIRILTLSPEWPGSDAFIARCTASGVTVSIGHTSASSVQIAGAVRAGARMSTHLGNGTHLSLPRHPNYIWEQLAQDELWSCVIADGFHLPDQVLKVVLKVKGPQALLVSDAVALCGMPPGHYDAAVGGRVTLTPEGKLHLAGNERLLAGSAQMLLRGIEHLSRRGLTDLANAWEMASVRPAAFMGWDTASGLAVGAPADLVVFRRSDEEGSLVVERTYKAGKLVYER
jgi:N-acetylglucosamine-6-phosphate deacetylase